MSNSGTDFGRVKLKAARPKVSNSARRSLGNDTGRYHSRETRAGQGAGQISGWDFRTRHLKVGDSARMARRETEAGVRRQTAVVELLVPPTDDRFSFAIRSASRGNLVPRMKLNTG